MHGLCSCSGRSGLDALLHVFFHAAEAAFLTCEERPSVLKELYAVWKLDPHQSPLIIKAVVGVQPAKKQQIQ